MNTPAPSDRRPVVVGVDADPAHRMALVWASDEAVRRRVPLRAVHAEGVPTRDHRGGRVPPPWEERNEEPHRRGKQLLAEMVDFVAARHPGIEADALLAQGEPGRVLGEQSRDATAVVLGSRHLGRVREVFSSASVVLPVLAHARCPVVVIPAPEHVTQEPAYYVVGVDGSEHSAAAIDLAFQEAALRGAEIRALYVWQPGHLRMFDEYASQQECRRLLSETVAGRRARYPEVELRHELVVGHPAQALADASAHALGVVVGTRRRGGFAGMLLGSVSQGVLHHARCPVFAVPTQE
ncbi:universal stress protein [Streptomyces sp. 900105755]